MKKILFIINSLHSLGGTERVATTLANGLAKDFNVIVLSQKSSGEHNAYKLHQDVNDIKLPKNKIKFILSINKYIKRENPDYVVIHSMSKLTPILLLSGIQAKNIWSMEHISYESHTKLFKKLRALLYNKLDKILVFTESQKNIYSKYNTSVNIVRNPCSLDVSNLKYNSASTAIISIGRLTNQKGFDLLIESWSKIEAKFPEWTLHIYGDGEDKLALKALINNYSLSNVFLEGQTEDVVKVYDAASFFVMSSRYEGLPMVLIEAQSRGLPIVSFDCPTGPSEIIENYVDGLLVKNGDTNDLADKIQSLIQDPTIRTQMSEKARLNSHKYSSETVINDWKNLIYESPCN